MPHRYSCCSQHKYIGTHKASAAERERESKRKRGRLLIACAAFVKGKVQNLINFVKLVRLAKLFRCHRRNFVTQLVCCMPICMCVCVEVCEVCALKVVGWSSRED